MGSSAKWCSTGICLGPLLFFIYVSDISDDVSSNVILFADDTKLYNCVERQEDRHTLAPNDTADSSCCANCVEPPLPPAMGAQFTIFGHADPLDGWRCCSQKRVMSRPIQVRQL